MKGGTAVRNCIQLRALRLKYGITLEELAQAAGVSGQYISRIELRQIAPTWTAEKKCEDAILWIIFQRYAEVAALERDFSAVVGRLLSPVEEEPYGI